MGRLYFMTTIKKINLVFALPLLLTSCNQKGLIVTGNFFGAQEAKDAISDILANDGEGIAIFESNVSENLSIKSYVVKLFREGHYLQKESYDPSIDYSERGFKVSRLEMDLFGEKENIVITSYPYKISEVEHGDISVRPNSDRLEVYMTDTRLFSLPAEESAIRNYAVNYCVSWIMNEFDL